jgi:hypothetical protein
VTSALAIGGLVLGIQEGPERGWTNALTLSGLVIGIAALILFVLIELRQENPLLDVRVFKVRALATGSVNLFVVFALMFTLFLVLIQFLQAALGYSALRSAAALLPMAAVMMPLSTTAQLLLTASGTTKFSSLVCPCSVPAWCSSLCWPTSTAVIYQYYPESSFSAAASACL